MLDGDVGLVEGGSVGGDVVWVAGEDLGPTVERGCYDDHGDSFAALTAWAERHRHAIAAARRGYDSGRGTAAGATELLTSGTYDSVAGGIAYDTMNDAATAAPGLPWTPVK
jgi:hypothetical protein